MEFTYNGQTFKIQFRYSSTATGERGAFTNCTIIPNPDYHMRHGYMGRAECSDKDQFCKETGRKIALRRALAKAFPSRYYSDSKAARRAAWQAYFARKQQPINAKSKEVKE